METLLVLAFVKLISTLCSLWVSVNSSLLIDLYYHVFIKIEMIGHDYGGC